MPAAATVGAGGSKPISVIGERATKSHGKHDFTNILFSILLQEGVGTNGPRAPPALNQGDRGLEVVGNPPETEKQARNGK